MTNIVLPVIGVEASPMALAIALAAIVAATMFLFGGAGGAGSSDDPLIELHPDHVAYMTKKEEDFCAGNPGKGLRCILDFLREEDDALTKQILAEKPKYEGGFEARQIDIHPGQFEYLEETHGISVSKEPGEEWKEISRAARACLDWAMRKEKEGDSQDGTLYEVMRCLNC